MRSVALESVEQDAHIWPQTPQPDGPECQRTVAVLKVDSLADEIRRMNQANWKICGKQKYKMETGLLPIELVGN